MLASSATSATSASRENKNKNKKQKISNEKNFDKEIKNKRFKHNGFIKDIVINNDKKR